MNGVELVRVLFLYRFLLLNCWVLIKLLEIKWFLFPTEHCLLSLDEIIWNVLGAFSLLGFLTRNRFIHVEIIKEVYLLLRLLLSLDRWPLAYWLVLEIPKEISNAIISNWLLLFYLLLCFPNPGKIRQAEPRKLFLLLWLSTLIERIRISQLTGLSKRIRCLGFRPSDVFKLREIQPVLFRITSYLRRKDKAISYRLL